MELNVERMWVVKKKTTVTNPLFSAAFLIVLYSILVPNSFKLNWEIILMLRKIFLDVQVETYDWIMLASTTATIEMLRKLRIACTKMLRALTFSVDTFKFEKSKTTSNVKAPTSVILWSWILFGKLWVYLWRCESLNVSMKKIASQATQAQLSNNLNPSPYSSFQSTIKQLSTSKTETLNTSHSIEKQFYSPLTFEWQITYSEVTRGPLNYLLKLWSGWVGDMTVVQQCCMHLTILHLGITCYGYKSCA